jgi:S-adenosylmethionine:tRNA ribosyltransferase-isomerase
VYASEQEEGSLAAPTAGLDITEGMLQELNHKFLTLHVGVEGFRPIDTDLVEDFQVSVAERYRIPLPPTNRVVCIGTTVVKALEAYALTGEAEGESKLFIWPPFKFMLTKAILTNFHSPKNVHLAMVSAFAGVERITEAYRVAIEKRYLFGAYGDACLIL